MPTAFCSRIMPLGTNATWTKWEILSSGRFWYLLLFCHNSRSKVNFKVKYDFLANDATNKCNTSISFNFDWKTHFWYYFNNSRSSLRSIWRSNCWKCHFYQIKLQTSVIPLFHGILTGKFISGIILMIQGHPQGQKVNFKVELLKMSYLTITIRNKCNNSIWCDFDYRIYLWYYYSDSRSSSRSKGQFQGQNCENMFFNNYK